jgi:hypothetical protein
MSAGRVINLRQDRRGRGDADDSRSRDTDEYSRILGDDWEPMGDGTYRFVGKQQNAPSLPWADHPLAASDDSPARSDDDPGSSEHAEDRKRRRWRKH